MLWAKIWDDTKSGIEWIKELPSISPGRWAVGYNYIYVMTRILNEMHPKNVLDLGLGISSSLIGAYFIGEGIKDGSHDVVEQDKTWIDFYSTNNRISTNTNLYHIECVEKVLRGITYNAYKDMGEVVKGKKYDVISIDGPKGSDYISRRDIVEFLPDILSDSFAIVIDDAERNGEKATVAEIRRILEKNSIEYYEGEYQGENLCKVIVSADNRFLCSL